jgi:hypothetical protein
MPIQARRRRRSLSNQSASRTAKYLRAISLYTRAVPASSSSRAVPPR